MCKRNRTCSNNTWHKRKGLQTAQGSFNELLSRQQGEKPQETDILRQELAEKQRLVKEEANDLQGNAKIHHQRHEKQREPM